MDRQPYIVEYILKQQRSVVRKLRVTAQIKGHNPLPSYQVWAWFLTQKLSEREADS